MIIRRFYNHRSFEVLKEYATCEGDLIKNRRVRPLLHMDVAVRTAQEVKGLAEGYI